MRTRRPPLPLTEQQMRPFTMKQKLPIIFLSTTSVRTDSSLRTRSAVFSSYAIGALLRMSCQDFREAVEAAPPTGANIVALIGRDNVRVTNRKPRASADRLQQVRHHRGRTRRAGEMPRLHQFPWRAVHQEIPPSNTARRHRNAPRDPF